MKAYLSSDGTPPPATRQARWRRFVERHLPSVVIYLMVATLVAVVLYPHVVVTVPSGHVGVLWKRFAGGTVLDPRRLRAKGFTSSGLGINYSCTICGCNRLRSRTTPSPAMA
jgi:hypothetical protein